MFVLLTDFLTEEFTSILLGQDPSQKEIPPLKKHESIFMLLSYRIFDSFILSILEGGTN